MGNWTSTDQAKGKRSNLPITEEEWNKHEGNNYVIFPHYLEDADDAGDRSGDEGNGRPRRGPRWSHIEAVLQRKIEDVDQFEKALADLACREVHCFFFQEFYSKPSDEAKRFFDVILPTIQRLALRLPELFPVDQRVPLLLQQRNDKVVLTQEQCACLLACSFMGALWIGPIFYAKQAFHEFDVQMLFVATFGPGVGKLQSVLHYFDRLSESIPPGKVTFRRQVLGKRDVPNWAKSTRPIRPIKVDPRGKIEDADTPFHADFANKYIGGGVLSRGCVQEEILFVLKPECLVSMLLCPVMEDNEVIFIHGAERFSDYQGYARTLTFGGDYVDTKRTEEGDIDNVIVAVDAIVAWGDIQWLPASLLRDLNKMYCSCWDPTNAIPGHPLATGNWGCGAFGGDKSLKAVQQMMAASQAERDMEYFTFGEKYAGRTLEDWLLELNRFVVEHNLSVGDLYKVITGGHGANVFEAIFKHGGARNAASDNEPDNNNDDEDETDEGGEDNEEEEQQPQQQQQ